MHYQFWSLQKCCINYISNNLAKLFLPVDTIDGGMKVTKLLPKYSNTFLPGMTGEWLLARLCEKRKLDNTTLSLFSKDVTRLKSVRIWNSPLLTKTDLRILASHHICELWIMNMASSVSLDDLIDCLGRWTLENLQCLNYSGSVHDIDININVESFGKLRSLQTLNLSRTRLDSEGLQKIADTIPIIHSLDISETSVNDLKALQTFSRLDHLNTFNLGWKHPTSDIDVILGLTRLRHLDISSVSQHLRFSLDMDYFLSKSNSLPELTSLDISGRWNIRSTRLRNFVDGHPELSFVGLAFTNIEADGPLKDVSSPTTGLPIRVTDVADLKQTVVSLRHYRYRREYVLLALQELESYLRVAKEDGCDKLTDDILEVILQTWDLHQCGDVEVSLAAMKCIGDLTSVSLMGYFRELTNRILSAMEEFNDRTQVQLVGVVAITRVLNHMWYVEVSFNYMRVAMAALKSLPAHRSAHPHRIPHVLHFLQRLIYKISSEERAELISEMNGTKMFTDIVKKKIGEPPSLDTELAYALGVLCNLVDECPEACKVVVEELEVLELVCMKSMNKEWLKPIQTNLFVILSNLAEVPEIRHALLRATLINQARRLVAVQNHSARLFAALFLSHLVSDGPDRWHDSTIAPHSIVAHDLEEAIMGWEHSSELLCIIGSFRPYLILLGGRIPAAQLCALWMMEHLCSNVRKGRYYCSMLVKEGGHDIIQALIASPDTFSHVLSFARRIDRLLPESAERNSLNQIEEAVVRCKIEEAVRS